MDPGNTLLLLALSGAAACVLLRKHSNYFTWMLFFVFLSLSSAVLLLFYHFVMKDYSLNYVFMYDGDHPAIFRSAAFWAGKEGMHLLLTWAAMLCILLFRLTNKIDRTYVKRTLSIALIIEILLLIITFADSPFRKMDGIDAGALSGHGLSPKFINIWFLVHPPLLVMAYAASIILFASAVVYLYSGEKEWVKTARSWGRFSWIMLSLGMATGGLWSYEIVEWNGFWRWDPVQSGALVTWLVLTAALHAFIRHGRNSAEYRTTAPLLAASVFILNIYVMFFARRGLRGSEHNFIGSAVWPLLLAGMFLAIIAVLFLISKRNWSDADGDARNMKPAPLLSMRSSFHATILLLCTLAFIPFWSILHSLTFEEIYDEFIEMPADVLNFWSFPVILLLTLLTEHCMLQGVVKKKNLVFIILASIFIGILTAIMPGTPVLLTYTSEFYQQSNIFVQFIGSISVYSYISISLLAISGIIFRFLIGRNRFSYHDLSTGLIHAGFILIVLGAVVSTSFSYEESLDYSTLENISQDISFTWSAKASNSRLMEIQDGWERTLDIDFYKNGNEHGSGKLGLEKSNRSGYFHKALIHRALFTDILIHFASDVTEQSRIKLNVKFVPVINLLWMGILLMIVGTVLVSLADFRH